MHVVAQLAAIFVDHRGLAMQRALRKHAADPGVGVVRRVARPLHDGIAQRHAGNSVAPAQLHGQLLGGVFGDAVGGVRLDHRLVKRRRLQIRAADGAGMLPLRALQLIDGPRPGIKRAMPRALIFPFAVDRLRRGHNHFFHGQPAIHDNFVEQRRGRGVDVEKAVEVGHVVLIRRQVIHVAHAVERAFERWPVAHVALLKLHVAVQIFGQAAGMYPRLQRIQHAHFELIAQQQVAGVRADKTCASGHQHSRHNQNSPVRTRRGRRAPQEPS